MAREIALSRFGGPEVLEARVVADSAPGPGEVQIRQTAIGVNFTDVHGRRSDYGDLRTASTPLVIGMEAAGGVGTLSQKIPVLIAEFPRRRSAPRCARARAR